MEVNLAGNRRYTIARLGVALRKPFIIHGLFVVSMLLFGLGGWLLIEKNTWALLAFSFGLFALAKRLWIKKGLTKLPIVAEGNTMADIISSNVLGNLPPKPTPQQLALALKGTRGGNFFASRYGITPDIISQLSSENTNDTAAVWQKALEVQANLRQGEVHSGAVAAALLLMSPAAADFLPRLRLDEQDILAGAAWYQHINDVFDSYHTPKKTGGFARDWSFGYTPLLQRFGVNISDQLSQGSLPHVALESHQSVIDQLSQLFVSSAHRNAALIGQLGVGKMAIVQAFAEKLLFDKTTHKDIRFHQVITLDAASLISAAPGRGELERLMNELLLEAYKAKNIILCLDNAQLFFEEGVGSVDVSNILLPVVEGGGLRLLFTMDDQRWLQISQRMPSLATSLNRVSIQPPTKPEVIRILQNQLLMLEYQTKATYMYQALETAYDLGDRYIQEQAMPGKAIKLLESAANFAEDGFVTSESVRASIEQTTGVKIGGATVTEERDTLLNMESLIHARMIGQERAVRVVSDALRRARSGVRNQNRPVGTFLFLGPTGVGKTELSKALADVYFGGDDRLLRIDLNQYVRSEDVARLIADSSSNEHSLAAQVSRQPFSVVLLDEIEKAHPDVLTTLLQVLDEGVLRDINGREVNCRDAIIIATSNAGANQIREYISAATPLDQVEKQITDQLISSGEFKPEFLNRFDEIVIFTPLEKEQLRQIIDLILESLNKNLAQQKITVQVTDEAKDLLVEAGYDPQLGARPMRRVVQRSVENVVARQMISGTAQPGSVIAISREDITQSLEV